jgi:ADP-ribose pyrophosphatase
MTDSSTLKFEIIEKETLYRGFFQLNRYQLKNQLYEGSWSEPYSREIFERGQAAAAVLLDPKQDILVLVEQFRPGAIDNESSPWMLELVAGMIESGEQPKDVVSRESIEEAGCQVKRNQKIYEYWVSPGGTSEKIWLYLAEVDSDNLPDYAGLSEEHEDIKVHKIPVNLAFQWLESGSINNAMTLIGLQWLKLNWHNKKDFWLSN